MLFKTALLLQFAVVVAAAQTNSQSVATSSNVIAIEKRSGSQAQTLTNSARADFQREKRVRAACIEGRRLICGKILDVLPEGLVVESGYTNLLREPLAKSWLIPGTVEASRAKNLIEGATPGTVCVGSVLVTDSPSGKKFRPARYDYVIIQGYPAGQYAYTSAGTVRRTIRIFSASLVEAIKSNLQREKKELQSSPRGDR